MQNYDEITVYCHVYGRNLHYTPKSMHCEHTECHTFLIVIKCPSDFERSYEKNTILTHTHTLDNISHKHKYIHTYIIVECQF